jgi:hypothetical protein
MTNMCYHQTCKKSNRATIGPGNILRLRKDKDWNTAESKNKRIRGTGILREVLKSEEGLKEMAKDIINLQRFN